jgi:hypothetical protein
MTVTNPLIEELTKAVTPIVSVGVGSAIWLVCKKLGKDPEKLQRSDLAVLKPALLDHYSKFWAQKMIELKKAIDQVR